MKQASPVHLVFFSILLTKMNCFPWDLGGMLENIVSDNLRAHDEIYGINRLEKNLNMVELPKYYGYRAEKHTVITEDGYILTIGRIRKQDNKENGPAVLVMHGFTNSADDFITAGPGRALSLQLADEGYDVWLGNARGNTYSKNHKTLSTKDPRFWNFTFHEIGYYDLPAMIDFVLMKTNQTQLAYVGHSQGTTACFIMFSLKPKYNAKIKVMVALALIAWFGHVRSPIVQALLPVRQEQYDIFNALGLYEVLSKNDLTGFIFRNICGTSELSVLLCETLLFTLYGYDYKQINMTQAPVELAHFPDGVSNKQAQHFLQLGASKKFQQFDYGTAAGNLKAYGSNTPPSYPVENITAPIAILYGVNDLLSVYEDVQIFISNARSVFSVQKVQNDEWNHMDFLWGKDANTLVNEVVLGLIKSRMG